MYTQRVVNKYKYLMCIFNNRRTISRGQSFACVLLVVEVAMENNSLNYK